MRQLRHNAMANLHTFSASDLVSLASGLANCSALDTACLEKLRDSVDAFCEGKGPDAIPARLSGLAEAACEPGGVDGSQGSQDDRPMVLADYKSTVALWKPPGWSCATSRASKGATDGRDGRGAPPRISDFLLKMLSREAAALPDHGLAHRLDIETSGALLVAKTSQSYWRLRLEFGAQSVRRQYLALVRGDLPLEWQCLDLKTVHPLYLHLTTAR